MKKKNIYIFIMLLIICITLVAIFGVQINSFKIKSASDIRFGIDIRGGVEAVYEPKDIDRKPTTQELENAKVILESRLDAKKIYDREITIDKSNGEILLRFPWKSDEEDFNPQKAIAELGETAKLTFRDSEGNVLLEGKDVVESTVSLDTRNNSPVVTLKFNENGTKLFAEATRSQLGKVISIYMDDTEISAPIVENEITNGSAIISNMNSTEEAIELSQKINSGSLPFSLVSKNHSTISPTCGYGALEVMIKAGVIVFICICIFMLSYYRVLGVVACFALLLQLSCQILALSIPQITLTLPGIAGMILSLGMGIDANIVISERIKEEIRAGKPIGAAIDSGYEKAFSAVFDGNLTSLFVAVILMIFGTGTMISFGYTLLIGIILNFLSGVFISKHLTKSMSLNKVFRKKSLYGVSTEVAKE